MARLGAGRLLTAATLAGLVGALGAAVVFWGAHHLRPPPADLHNLLHQDVPLNAAEQRRLDLSEQAFAERQAQIEARLKAANGRLAAAIQADPRWSPEVEAATREVEGAAADLQRATLVHVFEMRNGLDPAHRAAYDKSLISALKRGAR